MDSDGSTFQKQFDELTEKQRVLYFKHLEENAERAIADRKRVLEGFLRLCRLISPARVQEVEEKYPNVRLDEPGPFNELLMEIISATNLLRLSAAGANVDLDEALKKCHAEVLILEGQVKNERHRANQLQGSLNYCQEQLRLTRDQGKQRERARSVEKEAPKEKPAPKPQQPPPPQATEEQPTEESEAEEEKSPKEKRSRVSPEELKLVGAAGEWEMMYSRWDEKEIEMYVPLIKVIGTGTVALADIQAAFPEVKARTIEERLRNLTDDKYAILFARAYELREGRKAGRPGAAYELTLRGRAAYRLLTKESEREPIDKRFIALHKSPDHAELVLRAIKAFNRIGYAASNVEQTIALGDEGKFMPDIRVTNDDMSQIFVEAETEGHIQSKDLSTKWSNAVIANGNRIYLVMRKRTDAENLGYGSVRKWAYDVGFPEEIEVIVTGLDYLESLSPPQKGVPVSAWTKTKKIRPSTQKELLP